MYLRVPFRKKIVKDPSGCSIASLIYLAKSALR